MFHFQDNMVKELFFDNLWYFELKNALKWAVFFQLSRGVTTL